MGIVSVDTETKGLYGKIHRLGILCSNNDWHWLTYEEARRSDEWRDIILSADAVVLHNAKYDAKVMRRDLDFKFPWAKTHDTMVIAAMSTPATQPKDLLSLSMKFLDYDGKEDIDLKDYVDAHKIGGNYHKIPDKVLEPYTQRQLANTMCLYVYWRKKLSKAAYEIEQELVRVFCEMEVRGVKIDRDMLKSARTKLKDRISSIKSDIWKILDTWEDMSQKYNGMFGADLNLNSSKQVGEILVSRGYELPETETGYSTAESVLKNTCGGDPFIKSLLSLREARKLQSTYIESLLELSDREGVLRPNFSNTVTRTGRLSCSHPNLQNVAGRSESAKIVREAFVLRPGYDVYCLDYSQIEFRLGIFISEDPIGLAEFERGIDFHTATAAGIFEIPPREVTKELRSKAKTINFGVVYGMGVGKLARSLGISDEDAKLMLDQYAKNYEVLWHYKSKLIDRATKTGTVTLPLGRILHIEKEKAYKAFNYKIQGAAATIIKKAMVDVGEFLRGKRSNLLLQIHDELIFEQHKSEDVLHDVYRIMRSASSLCPLDVDIEKWEGSWYGKKSVAPF